MQFRRLHDVPSSRMTAAAPSPSPRAASAAAPRWSGARHLAVPALPLQARLLRGRGRRLSRSRLESSTERASTRTRESLLVVLTWLVLGDVELDEAERRPHCAGRCSSSPPAATRTASSRSTTSRPTRLAAELDAPERRTSLAAALDRLAAEADGLPTVTGRSRRSSASPDLAWRRTRSPCSPTSSPTRTDAPAVAVRPKPPVH